MMKCELTGSVVFIVDDHPTNLGVLVEAISNKGLNVAVAKSGEKAIKRVEQVKPDLILLDVLMPGIDGFETCRRLKQKETIKDVPVIFMTALTETVEKIKGFQAGGVDYITKPFQVEEVLARVHTHLTIRKLQQQLQEQIAMKDKFFSILAHDLRAPLIGFLSFSGILENLENLRKDEIITLTKQFRESAENLFALLENLLTWSRIQRGMIQSFSGQVPLELIVKRVVDLLTLTAGQKQITLVNNLHDRISVYADVNLLETIIRNLLSNAIKFTEAGGTVEISAKPDERMVTVDISDTGIGISEKKLSGLFRIDVTSQRMGTAGEKGTGLGLILCKEFIETHGGKIWVTSKVGQGTTFTFTLPKNANGIPV